jgi:hypothetical protein
MAVLGADNPAAPAVAAFDALLRELLAEAERVKEVSTIEPALNKSDFDDLSGRVSSTAAQLPQLEGDKDAKETKARQFGIIETAARDIFSNLIVGTDFLCDPRAALTSLPSQPPPSILPTSSRCGTYSISFRSSPMMGNATLLSCFGWPRSYWTAKLSPDAARSLTFSNRDGNESRPNTSSKSS